MTARRSNSANAWETTLTSQMAPTDLTAVVATTTGGPASPCYLVVEPDKAGTQLEIIYFDGTFTGTTFVTSGIGNRYLTGSSAASGLTHPVGSKVRSAPPAQLFTDIFDSLDAKLALVGGTLTGPLVLAGNAAAALNPVSLQQWQTKDDKDSVRAATTGALAAGTYSGGVFTVTATGALAAQDGVTLIAGDRLLVKNQATGSQNGIYTVTTVGDGTHQAVLTRATDFDTSAKITPNARCSIEEGTTLAGSSWRVTNTGTITLDTTALTFGLVPAVAVSKGGTLVGRRGAVNLVEGTNVTMTVADNSGSDRVDVTVNATSGSTPIFSGVRVRNAADQNVATGTVTALTFDTDVFKSASGYHSTSINTSRLVAQTTSKHKVYFAAAYVETATAGVQRKVQIFVNGTMVTEFFSTPAAATGKYVPLGGPGITLDLTAGDYVEVKTYQDSGSTIAVLGHTTGINNYPVFGLEVIGQ